jgi:hypothetical protein
MLSPSQNPNPPNWDQFTIVLGWAVAWAWTIAAGGGGLWLLVTKGPLPLTNGWFALFSGVAACPLTSSLIRAIAGFSVSARARFAVAVAFFVAGRIALVV